MSQGSVAVLPIGIVFAAGAAVVVAAASAAVLVAYAANQAAEGTLRVVGRKGAALEAEGAAQCEADRESLRWQAAAADVVGLNARLRMAAGQAHRLGVPVDVPPPLDLRDRSREDAIAWAVDAERKLVAAHQRLDAAATRTGRARLLADLPVAAVDADATARALTAYQAVLRASREVHEPRRPDVVDDVAATLGRVDPDATPAEHEAVLRAALLARTRQDADDADAYLLALERLVGGIRAAAVGRRQAAQWLQALELPAVVAALTGSDPRPPYSGTAARLRAVVAGNVDLDEKLRDEGRRAVAWAGEVTRREYLRDRLVHLFEREGYQVDVESEGARGTRLTASHGEWGGEHSALLFVEDGGAVTGRLARNRPRAGDDAALDDRARCDALHALLHQLGSPPSGATVTVEVDQPPALAYTRDAAEATPHVERPKYRTR